MPISIQDVAKKANVSISTVSRVLNRRNIVNEETRKRIESPIDDLGYSPNVCARGLMLPDLHGEFYSEIIRGANLRARELGYKLMISSAVAKDDGSELMAAFADHGMVDGLVVMISESTSRIRETLRHPRIVRQLIACGATAATSSERYVALTATTHRRFSRFNDA